MNNCISPYSSLLLACKVPKTKSDSENKEKKDDVCEETREKTKKEKRETKPCDALRNIHTISNILERPSVPSFFSCYILLLIFT